MTYNDEPHGYTFDVHTRDNFKCRYCGADGAKSFDTWLTLTRNHLLPKGHPNRDNPDFIVTACRFCNDVANQYSDLAEKHGMKFDGMTPEELVAQWLPYVEETRRRRREVWERRVIATHSLTER